MAHPARRLKVYDARMERTVFHKIIDREIPAAIVHEDGDVLAFKDIHPRDATHVLFVPKAFLESVAHVTTETEHIPGMLILAAQRFAKEKGIDGYKLTFHVGKGGGQEVPYIHLHFLSSQALPEQ
jgi:histidine triad (HIT) family protein